MLDREGDGPAKFRALAFQKIKISRAPPLSTNITCKVQKHVILGGVDQIFDRELDKIRNSITSP
jgi:hypothetical protein